MPLRRFTNCLIGLAVGMPACAAPPTTQPTYHPYAGNTHAHTSFTWSHGDQWITAKPKPGEKKEPHLTVDPDGSQRPANQTLKPDWKKSQGPPAAHFALAKANHYDFYATTDHSQEADFQPPGPTNPKWVATTRAAADATDSHFVAIAGYEHSENNGPNGTGHLNVFNSAEYLNAMAPSVELPTLYQWLKTAPANGDGPVVASFNHPGPHQYNNWDYRDPQITDVITMLEVINSNNKIHYEGFLAALEHGWKVSPVCGNDNHGLWGITHHTSRTVLLATELTKPALLDAMKHRRTYATLQTNLQCTYTVNNQIMGSTLAPADAYHFDISITDPDTDNPKRAITKIDLVTDHGTIAETYTPDAPAHTIRWQPTLHTDTAHYFFPRIYTAGGGDAPKPDPAKPVAWLAPIWIRR